MSEPKGSWRPLDVDPVKGQIEVSVDELGGVFLRGVVASEQAGREIEDAARQRSGRDIRLEPVSNPTAPANLRRFNRPLPRFPCPVHQVSRNADRSRRPLLPLRL